MMTNKALWLTTTLSSLSLPLTGLFAQTAEPTPEDLNYYVRESASFLVTSEYAPNANGIEIFTTGEEAGEEPFDLAVSYETFLATLNNAFDAGLGGVVNFDTPIFGDALREVDRTMIRATAEDLFFDQAGEDLTLANWQRIYNEVYAELVDENDIDFVVNRNDASSENIAEGVLPNVNDFVRFTQPLPVLTL